MSVNYIIKIGNNYRYRRRVPEEVSHLDKRKEVKISLKTKDYNTAIIKADIYNQQMEIFWKSLIASGSSENINEKYDLAVQLAKSYGFAYKTPEQISTSALNEITDRLLIKTKNRNEIEAVLGGVDRPEIKLSNCCNLYWDLTVDRLVNKSENQIRKWKNPRKLAMNDFIKVVGDKFLHQITRKDIIDFRSYLSEKIKAGLKSNTANKKLMHVKDVLKVVSINNEIDLEVSTLFIETFFKKTSNSRPPFEASYVQNILLPNLSSLNERDRNVLMAMADTGMRTVEVFGLRSDDIFLDSDIPHIWIRSREGYSLKTPHSERKIPLVGSALIAFQIFPNGFEHLGHPDTFSNIVNKYLKKNNLRPTPQHSAYSLRHTFKDRLRDVEAPEEIIDELMGHKKKGIPYGRGHKLETKYKWMEKIAYLINKFD